MKLIIYGIGPFSKLMHYYLENDSKYEVVAFCADKVYINEDVFCGLPLHCFDNIEDFYEPDKYQMLVAIGYSKMRNRESMFYKAKDKGYILINYIHSSVIKNNLFLGENNIILAGCVIEPNVIIKDNNVVWSMSLLGHDCKLGSHNYISAKCLIAGSIEVKNLCFIGNGVNTINNLVIENETYLVAGSNVRKNTKKNGMYIGDPAKLFKTNEKGIEIG